MLGDHGIYYKAMCLYEGLTHVPLIIHYPKALAPRRYAGCIELLHVAPTLLEAAGAAPEVGMQASSVWQQMLRGEDIPEEVVMTEYYNSVLSTFGDARHNFSTMIRGGRYKLSLCHGSSEGELYDLLLDPTETVNRFNDPDYLSIKADMLVRLSNKQAWSTDPLPERICRF